MARLERLPPPPAVPPRSPPVDVAGETALLIPPLGSLDHAPSLDGRLHVPVRPERAVLLCHPHPLYGGSMHSPVPLAIAKTLADVASEKVAWLRFDFRGVGASEGKYDEGRGEVDDARAALAALRRAAPGVPLSLAGHSFGSWVGLRAASVDRMPEGTGRHERVGAGVERVLLLAPSVRFFEFHPEDVAFRGPITIFVGDQDELLDVAEAEALAAKLGASLRVFPGFDHHFMKSRRTMAEAAMAVLAPEL